MSPLKLSVLGSPGIEQNSVPVELGSRKALALFIYLVLTESA